MMRSIVVTLGLLAACGSEPATPDASVAPDATQYTDCERALEGRTFKGPFVACGVCGCGATFSCDASVTFDQLMISWSYSDVVLNRPYTCTNGTIVVAGDQQVTASYDGVIDFVTLDGDRYDPCPGTCDLDRQTCEDVCPTTGVTLRGPNIPKSISSWSKTYKPIQLRDSQPDSPLGKTSIVSPL